MPQVVRTTNDLIVNSLYMLGELGVGETPDAFMLSTGLDLINELLDKFSSDSIYIPYLTTLDSQFTVGQDTYSISDMMSGVNIVSDRIIDLTFANYTVPATGVIPGPQTSNFITNTPLNSQLIITSGNSYSTGTALTVSVTDNGTLPAPLLVNTIYYSIFVDSSHILLATSFNNAINGIFIVLTSNGNTSGVFQLINSNPIGQTQPAVTSLVYPLRIINKATYWNVVRQTNLLARPGFIFLNKQAQESFVTVYPVPDQPYPFSIQVKSMINELGNQDSLGELPPVYYGFMKRSLARIFKSYYPSGNWTPEMEEEYMDYFNIIKNANETDLTIRPSVLMTAPEPFYWPNILAY